MISVVTLSQYKRNPLLRLLTQCIESQTKKPNEWIIVEGSSTKEDADQNALFISDMKKTCMISIVYVPFQDGTKLGGLRNRGNQACSGDIIVCMDDDDFYPSTRIEHVLERFHQFPTFNIAGCTNMVLYDFSSRTLYQCRGYHSNHSTNNAMAWKKSYLNHHQHDKEKTFGEESSFTNQFSEPMIQLSPLHTVITSCHSSNTFDKTNVLQNQNVFHILDPSLVTKIIPESLFKQYEFIFTK